MDPDGFSDPFVRVEVCGCSDSGSEKQTRVSYRTLFPQWDETLRMHVRSSEVPEASLRLSIWDHDVASAEKAMGSVEIPLQDLSFTSPINPRMYLVTLDKPLQLQTHTHTRTHTTRRQSTPGIPEAGGCISGV